MDRRQGYPFPGPPLWRYSEVTMTSTVSFVASFSPNNAIARVLFVGIVLLALTAAVVAQNPVPLISQPLVPDVKAPGGGAFTLTVNGTSFVPGAAVKWNGSARATAFVSGSRVTATILAADIAKAGTASVTVVN